MTHYDLTTDAVNVDDVVPLQIQLLNVAQVMRALQISRSTVYRWTRQKRIPAPISVGGRLRWRSADILALIKGETHATTP